MILDPDGKSILNSEKGGLKANDVQEGSKLGHSSADLGPVLDPDAKLHRRESRANERTNLGKANEAIPEVPDSEGGDGCRSSWGQRQIAYRASFVSAAARRASGCRKWSAAGWLGRCSLRCEER